MQQGLHIITLTKVLYPVYFSAFITVNLLLAQKYTGFRLYVFSEPAINYLDQGNYIKVKAFLSLLQKGLYTLKSHQ